MISVNVTDLDGERHEIRASAGDVLMEVLREQEWGVAALCGGMCSCATCHVYLDEPWTDRFPEKQSDEEELLELMEDYRPNSRLSCQLRLEDAHDGLSLVLAPEE